MPFSYQELHDIRVAFCAYEHQDLKGMLIDENIIMRCLKVWGLNMLNSKRRW